MRMPGKQEMHTALGIAKGVKDYAASSRKASSDAYKNVAKEQSKMVQAAQTGTATRTPYGSTEYGARVKQETKRLKQERGVSLKSSIVKGILGK